MFERSSDIRLDDWRRSGRKTVPLVTGPRCVGKTTSVRRLGEDYGSVVEIDMSDPRNRKLFTNVDDTDGFVSTIETTFGRGSVVPGDTLVVLDEVGFSPESLEPISALSDRESVDILMTASCFSMSSIPRDSPTPWIERIDVRPLDFRGFLRAMGYGEEVDRAEADLSSVRVADRDLDRTMTCMFRRYLVTGGMPQAVERMASSGRLSDVRRVCRDIVGRQMADARRTSPYIHDIIRGCLESVPRQLKGNGRFMYSRVADGPGASPRHCAEGVQWLSASGIVDLCHKAMDPVEPPSVRCQPDQFKAYTDTGTLFGLMDGWVSDAALNGNFGNCPCAVLEDCAARQITSAGAVPSYYQRNRHEADFLVPSNRGVTGVVVRSGNNSRRKSLSRLMDEGQITGAVEFGESDRPGDSERYPLWAMGFPGTVIPGLENRRSGDRRIGFTARSGSGRCLPGRSPRPSRPA